MFLKTMKSRLIKKVHPKGICPETLQESEAQCISIEVKKVIGQYMQRAKEVYSIEDYWGMVSDVTEKVSVSICKESTILMQYNGFWVLKSQVKRLNQLTKNNIKEASSRIRKERPSKRRLRKMYESIHWDILGMCEELRRLIRAQVIMRLQTELNLDVETQMMKKVLKEIEKAAVSEEQQVREENQNNTDIREMKRKCRDWRKKSKAGKGEQLLQKKMKIGTDDGKTGTENGKTETKLKSEKMGKSKQKKEKLGQMKEQQAVGT